MPPTSAIHVTGSSHEQHGSAIEPDYGQIDCTFSVRRRDSPLGFPVGDTHRLGRDILHAWRTIILVGIVLSGIVGAGYQPSALAEEQRADSPSPREMLGWPRAIDARHALRLPLGAFDGHIAADVHLVRDTSSVAIYDPDANRVYSGGNAGPVAGASLSKVLMAIIALQDVERHNGDEDETTAMRESLYPMIVYSDNDVANEIWEQIGRQDAIETFGETYDLPGFRAPDPWDWGQVSATARDWAILFAMLGSGQLLDEDNTSAILSMMGDVIEEHRWGVLTRRDDSVSFGKNGWYMDEDESSIWRVNSAGFVSIEEPNHAVTPRVVVVLTRYPGEDGISYGVDLATHITGAVVACTHTQQARTTRAARAAGCTSARESAMLLDRARRIW